MRGSIVTRWASVAASVMLLVAPVSRADDAELDQLKKAVEQMQNTINTLNQKIEKLERERQQEKAAAPAQPSVAAAPEAPPPLPTAEAARQAVETVLTSQGIGPQAPVDPAMRGFVRIPNTGVMLRFNAKPRVDFTYDTGNAGDDSRFVRTR
jgi:TolA-binding protein